MHRKKVLVLAGPTAVGKTALSIAVAQELGAEVVSADSIQLYRGMDIGSAKPSLQERAGVPHHMMDVRDVNSPMNVAEFYLETIDVIEGIFKRAHLPIIVGGAGFYLHVLMHGLPSTPPANPQLRAELLHRLQVQGVDALYHSLQQLDAAYAATITCRDQHKIIRALEIITLTQLPVSAFKPAHCQEVLAWEFIPYFLDRPREELYERINARCHHMVDQGLVEEVESLIPKGLLDNSAAAHAIGYRQTLAFLETPRSGADWQHYHQALQLSSRHYAKRQLTWFRHHQHFRRVNMSEVSPYTFVRALTASGE